MANYKIKYRALFKAATICLAGLFFTNTFVLAISDTLSPRVGNPEVYQKMREMMNAKYAAHQKPLPIQPNLVLSINLSGIGANIEGGRVVCNGDSLNNVEELIPILAESGVGTLYFYGGLYEMSELSKKVHDNPAHNNDSRVITSGKTTVLVRNYPTQRETVGGVELKDAFGNPFSIYSMKRFNPRLSTGDAREHFRRVVKKAHQAGMKVIVDFIPSLSPDAINNYRWIEHKELDDSDKELFRNMPEPAKEAWLKGLLERPENNAYFVVEYAPGRVVLGKHVVSLGINFDQTRLDPLNEDVQRYYIESLKSLIDLGVDSVRVDLAFHLLIHGLPDEKQPLKIIIDAAEDYARSKGQEMDFALEAYGDEAEQKWLIRLGADHVYSMRLFEAYWNIVRNNGNAGGIKDAVWHALFTEQRPLISPSNFDQTALTAIGGGTKGFAMLLMAIGHLRKAKARVMLMFDLRDWLLYYGYLLKMPPGGSPDPYDKSQHLFVTEEELKIWTDFSKMKDALKNAPLKKVMQDFYNSVLTNEEKYIESPGISHPDKLFPLCWKTENGDWTMLVVNFKPSVEIIQARVDLPEEIKGAAGVVVNDMLNRGAAAHVEGLAGIDVDFKPQEEYKIYTIKNPASIRAPELADTAVGIKNTQYLLGILPPAAEDESGKYVIRYNEKSLQDYETRAGIEAGTLEKLLNAYVDLLRVRLGGKDRIKLQPSSSTSSKRQPLIAAEYYHGPNKILTGKGCVDIEGEELDKYSTLRILEMANLAFAISNIPIEQMPGERDRYNILISFIQNQYKGLTGKEISLEEILRPDRIIILPSIKSIPPEELREYYELTIKQLKQAA